MPIYPLPQFEADLQALTQEQDRAAYEALKPPRSLVVRYGSMKLVGEFPYDGKAKPGCGSKIVVRTPRGTEVGEMLTSTCPNSGCSKSVSRKEMLQYIENSGGRDYPFFTDGKVYRVATPEDLERQQALEQAKHELKLRARAVAAAIASPVKVVEVEPLLGGERLIVHYLSEERIELRDLGQALAAELVPLGLGARVDLHAVGARDEARLTADYEKCGQYCCCKNFLKVLKPVSMKSAKVQKATLDPLKISGRCGRLMCCLRYEDATYDELRKRLPHKKRRVGTPEGDGIVMDTQILTQLVLVRLDQPDDSGKIRDVAIPVESLADPVSPQAPAGSVNAPGWQPPLPGPRGPRAPMPNAAGNAGPGVGPPSRSAGAPLGSASKAQDGGTAPAGGRGGRDPGGKGPPPPFNGPRAGMRPRPSGPPSGPPLAQGSGPVNVAAGPSGAAGAPQRPRPNGPPPPRPRAPEQINLDDIPLDDGREGPGNVGSGGGQRPPGAGKKKRRRGPPGAGGPMGGGPMGGGPFGGGPGGGGPRQGPSGPPNPEAKPPSGAN